MQHYKPSGQPWYVRHSIENNPLRNDLHFGGGSNGLESAVSDVYVNNDVNNGPFGYIGRVAGKISSAIPASAKRIAAVSGLAGLLGLLYLEAACSSPGPIQNPSFPSTPTPAISQRTLTELTAQELISQVRANPNKYKSGTPIRVSGVVTDKGKIEGVFLFLYLGPSTKDYSVAIVWNEYSDYNNAISVRKGDSVVIDTKYQFLLGDKEEKLIQLIAIKIIQWEQANPKK